MSHFNLKESYTSISLFFMSRQNSIQLDDAEMPEIPARPRPGFRPISRTNSVVARDKQIESQARNDLDQIPLADLIKKNFGIKSNKNKDKDDENNEDNDELIGDTNFENAIQAADYVNPFTFTEDDLRKEGLETTNQYQKGEFNEPLPPRFGTLEKPATKRWTKEETEFFYQILKMCGTDFSMMSKYFTNRTRRMIVSKFHVEEKKNKKRIEECLASHESLDLSLYARTVGLDEGSIVEEYKRNKSKLIQSQGPMVYPKKKAQTTESDSSNSSDDLVYDSDDDEPLSNQQKDTNINDVNDDENDEIQGDLDF